MKEADETISKDVAPSECNADDTETNKDKNKDKKCVGGIWKCNFCDLEERFDYKGSKPPFAKHLSFLEDCYIMKDPFSPPNRGEILVLGADCSICGKSVCTECSLFYAIRFCKDCSFKNIENLPQELKSKIIQLNRKDNEEGM